jgi:hypothetical protein
MEPEFSLPCLQERFTGAYLKPNQSIPILSLTDRVSQKEEHSLLVISLWGLYSIKEQLSP